MASSNTYHIAHADDSHHEVLTVMSAEMGQANRRDKRATNDPGNHSVVVRGRRLLSSSPATVF